MAEGGQPKVGLFDSLRALLDSGAGLAQRRLQLLAIEVREQKLRLLDHLLRVAVISILGLLALMSATAAVIVAFWDTHPVLVLAVVTVAYGGLAGAMAWGLRRRLREGAMPFAGTLEEFRKDRECFGKRN
jgi:uncharacterized membrane protein YqjE